MSESMTNRVAEWSMALLLQVVALVKRIADLPNLADSAAVRDWVRHLVELVMKLPDHLPDPVQRGAELLAAITASDAAWAAFYRLLLSLYSSERAITASTKDVLTLREQPEIEGLLGELAGPMAAQASELGEDRVPAAGFDPMLIVQIAIAIINLLKELRKS